MTKGHEFEWYGPILVIVPLLYLYPSMEKPKPQKHPMVDTEFYCDPFSSGGRTSHRGDQFDIWGTGVTVDMQRVWKWV